MYTQSHVSITRMRIKSDRLLGGRALIKERYTHLCECFEKEEVMLFPGKAVTKKPHNGNIVQGWI